MNVKQPNLNKRIEILIKLFNRNTVISHISRFFIKKHVIK